MAHSGNDAQFSYEDHFTPARSRKRRKNRPLTELPSTAALLDRTADELAPTPWLRDTIQSLRSCLQDAFTSSDVPPSVLCLGLGSPTASRDARAQLAFLLAACDDLSIERSNVSAFDPVFVDEDRQLLAQRRLTVLPENSEARYGLQSLTIVFMPHCDLHLYENLLRENWSLAQLSKLVLIANRLSEYAESIPARKLAAEHPCVARLVPHLTSRPFAPCAPFPTAFNNTALQYAPRAALSARSPEFWALPSSGTGVSAPAARPGSGAPGVGARSTSTSTSRPLSGKEVVGEGAGQGAAAAQEAYADSDGVREVVAAAAATAGDPPGAGTGVAVAVAGTAAGAVTAQDHDATSEAESVPPPGGADREGSP